MSQLFILYEHAAGYAVFSVKEFEEIAMFLPQVEASVADVVKFKSIVKLVAFAPFKTAVAALENINAISEGIASHDLVVFLDDIFSKFKKKNCIIGIADPKLCAAVTEAIGVQCNHFGAVPEIIRGIRLHFDKLVKGFTAKSAGVAQLGLGHSYSSAKVKLNVHRADNMIIQSIALLDQLDKDINTFAMRVREWYSYHFPELVKIVPDNYLFAKVAHFTKDRKSLTQNRLEALEEILMDSSKAQAIINAASMSMGMDISPIDLINIEMFSERIVKLSDYRKTLHTYLHNKMVHVAPNLQVLIGDVLGARLISRAGSLTNLAKYPASTVQILGAEKALFRALKNRTKTPKYGLLYNSSFIGQAGLKNKGRISRFLANKCTIASRIDCFTEQPTDIFGKMLKGQVEERLRFYESGEVPRKNIEVMQEAIMAVGREITNGIVMNGEAQTLKKKNKKKKKKAAEETTSNNNDEVVMENAKNLTFDAAANENNDDDEPKKKKKKKNKNETINDNDESMMDGSLQKDVVAAVNGNGEPKKKKKKKKVAEEE